MPAVASNMMYFSASLPNSFTASLGSVVMDAVDSVASATSVTSACRYADLLLIVHCDIGVNAEMLLMRHSEPITLIIFMVAGANGAYISNEYPIMYKLLILSLLALCCLHLYVECACIIAESASVTPIALRPEPPLLASFLFPIFISFIIDRTKQ